MSLSRYFINIEDRSPVEFVSVYPRGAMVNGAQADVNTVTVHDPHAIAASDLFLFAPTRLNVSLSRVFTASSVTATSITFSGGTFTFPHNGLLVPLGTDTVTANADGSWPLPRWDGSSANAYGDVTGVTAYANAAVPTDPGNEVGFWAEASIYWLVGRSALGRPVRVYPDVSATAGAGTGTTLPASPSNGDMFWLRTGAGTVSILYIYGPDSGDTSDWNEVMRTG